MNTNVRISRETFTTATGFKIRVVHPAFVPMLFDDLRDGLEIAIAMLKAGHVSDVMRAFDYALAKVCFAGLRDAESPTVMQFVDQPVALFRLGWTVGNDELDMNLPTLETEITRYFHARTRAFNWYASQVWKAEIKSVSTEDSISWAVPDFEEWLSKVWLTDEGTETANADEYPVLAAVMQDPALKIDYIRTCSIAWLENIREHQNGKLPACSKPFTVYDILNPGHYPETKH